MDDPQPSVSNSVGLIDQDRNITNQIDTNNSQQKRQCWVCFGTDQDETQDQDVIWVCPCKCKGSMKWVHEDCLQRWIDEKQKRVHSLRVSCSQCKTNYILSFPPASRFIRFIEQYDKLLYGSSPFVAVSILVGSLYLCSASYGFITIIQVMGYEDGRRLIDEADPMLLIIGLPTIPITLVLAKFIKWEDFLLKLWKESAYNIPRPLSFLIDKPPLRPRANCDQILLDPAFNEPLGCTRMICGGLLLPSMSVLFGKLFFSKFTETHWRRSILGGLTFLILKGALKIYLRKSQYMRYSQRTIKDYVPTPKSQSNSTSGQTSEHSHQEEPVNEVMHQDDNNETSPSRFDSSTRRRSLEEDEADDDSDNDEQSARGGYVFSMTLSLGR